MAWYIEVNNLSYKFTVACDCSGKNIHAMLNIVTVLSVLKYIHKFHLCLLLPSRGGA